MEADASRRIYEKQKGGNFVPVTCTLIDGRKIEGVIVAFKFGEPDHGDSFITQWHIVPASEAMNGGRGFLGALVGELIRHSDVAFVSFPDGTIIYNSKTK